VRGRVYFNYDEDWRTDFTVAWDMAAVRLAKREGLDLLALEGKRLRVRGLLRWYNGPLIDATHPEQVEVLG
jgi:hypothetical protein